MFKDISRGLIALVTASNIATAQENRDGGISPYMQSCLEEFSKITVDDVDAQIEWSLSERQENSYQSVTAISRRSEIIRKTQIAINFKQEEIERITLRFGIGYHKTPSMQASIRVVHVFNDQTASMNRYQARSTNNVVLAMQDETKSQVVKLEQAIEVCGLYHPPIEVKIP